MTPNGRGTGGLSTHLELQHPGNVGAYPHGPSATSLERPLVRARLDEPTDYDDFAPRDSSTSARRSPKPRSTKSRAYLVIRRVHLYLGLVLLPFVALYGATALFFNHASWFRDIEERPLDAHVVAQSEIVALGADPFALARDIAPAGIEPLEVRWEGAWVFESRGDGRVERIDVDPAGRGGRMLAWPEDPKPDSSMPATIAASSLATWSDPLALAAALAPRLGARDEALVLKRAPKLAITYVENGQPLLARWDPANGSVRVVHDDGHDPVDFLLSLHKAHGSPGYADARWWWSWIVDAMGFAMLAWAASGVVLWWSIRAVRRAGLVALGIAAVAFVALFAGMHAVIPI